MVSLWVWKEMKLSLPCLKQRLRMLKTNVWQVKRRRLVNLEVQKLGGITSSTFKNNAIAK